MYVTESRNLKGLLFKIEVFVVKHTGGLRLSTDPNKSYNYEKMSIEDSFLV